MTKPDQEVVVRAEEQLVVFQLAEQTYGIEIESVYEIIRMEKITKVPRTPQFVEGVINLRGNIIPVIDLCKRFGLTDAGRTNASRIIVVDVGGNTIGMTVDAVSEVLRITTGCIEPPPSMVNGIDAAYLRGIANLDSRLIILIDLEKILLEEEKGQLHKIEPEAV